VADHLLDVVVFGPAGLALTAVEEFPKLVDKGRNHLEGQVRTARIVGQVAVQMGRRQLESLTRQWTSKESSPAPGATRSGPEAAPAPSPSSPVPAAEPERTASGVAANGHGDLQPLAIPGYDSLSASQVVQRLAGLSHGELIDVRAHEQSHRHRRTILNRVEQLLAGVDAG
jgi:hypothetical protein